MRTNATRRGRARPPSPAPATAWMFLTNHALVLQCLAERPDARTRDVAQWIGITDRAVQRIVAELTRDGYLRAIRVGRRKRYTVVASARMRHQLQARRTIAPLLALAPALPDRDRR